jgi:hypothetical protein
MSSRRGALFLFLSTSMLTAVSAQSNGIQGMDVQLNRLETISALGRSGAYPNGQNGCAMSTTSCNVGTVNIPWYAPMQERHPLIAFLAARESEGRFEQISDYSFVKHGFLATNSPGCGTCISPGTSSLLGVRCTDTYGTGNNGDNYYLGPAAEIDPWLGTWQARGSHFDRGEPDVGAPLNNDGIRSLTGSMASALGPVAHRMVIADQDFLKPNSTFFYSAQYVIDSEFESVRGDNLGWRRFTAAWSGTRWNLAMVVAQPMAFGSILDAWSGATVQSNTNGADDGRFYVAVKVEGPVNGLYTYRYAVHNRDNRRGGGALRIPICADARVANPWFRDVDGNASNDWTFTRTANEIVFTAPTGAALRWNSFYNFEFVSDAGPVTTNVSIDQADAGAGAAFVSVASRAPLGLDNQFLGDGCGTPTPPTLYAVGTPAKAQLGNATFGVELGNLVPNAGSALVIASANGNTPLGGGCTLYMDPLLIALTLAGTANASGIQALPLPIPTNSSLEGASLTLQGIELQTPGAYLGAIDLSNGLKIRIGSNISNCP